MGITLKNVGFTYLPGTPMSREALSSVDLELREGEILCLVGRTGAGKSTLVNIMCGLLRPTCGEIALDGRGLDGRSGTRALREAAGVLMQSPERQLFAETVERDVAFGPRNRGTRGEELAQAVRVALASTGLDPDEYASRSPFSLSGGEMRRVALAGVLAMSPRYLLMDEPFSGLDLPGREMLCRALDRQRGEGIGVLLVTHDWEEVERLADRIAVLSHGHIALGGARDEVLAMAEELEAAGLKPPALVAVLAALRRRGLDLPSCLPSAAEAAAIIHEALRGSSP